MFHFLSGWIKVSVDREADRPIHLLADESGGSGVRLDCGAGQDPVCGQNLLLCCSSGLLGLLQLPEEDKEMQLTINETRRLGSVSFTETNDSFRYRLICRLFAALAIKCQKPAKV